ncbi:hypothetical protein ES708_21275 [subsurface metagenome]
MQTGVGSDKRGDSPVFTLVINVEYLSIFARSTDETAIFKNTKSIGRKCEIGAIHHVG